LNIFAFLLIGTVTGIGSVLMLLRFDSSWIKAFSLSGGASILIGEFLLFAEALNINDENRSTMLVCLLLSWIIVFSVLLVILLQSFKKQETRYKIHTWEILLGNKSAIEDYYKSKKQEIESKLLAEFDIVSLTKQKEDNDIELKHLNYEKDLLVKIREDANEILDKKHKLCIPVDHSYAIKQDFFDLIPKFIQSISNFQHHLSMYTADFIKGMEKPTDKNREEIFRRYLKGLGYYIGQYLFDWRDVRVHFRKLDPSKKTYESYVISQKKKNGQITPVSPIPIGNGLIKLATESKRSIVYSANKRQAFSTGSEQRWKDYITTVFDQITIDGQPLLSLGISVKHHIEHKDMLYFLSYIQFEEVIQENILELNQHLSIFKTSKTEAA